MLFNLNFQPLEVVSRYRETQLQVTANLCDLRNLSRNISDRKHILLLTTGYTYASKNTECVMSTSVFQGLTLILLITSIVVFNQFYWSTKSLLLGMKCVSKHQDLRAFVLKLNKYE